VSGSESETRAAGEGSGLIGECGGVSRPRENEGTSELAMEIGREIESEREREREWEWNLG